MRDLCGACITRCHTERAYCDWTERCVRRHGTRHRRTSGTVHARSRRSPPHLPVGKYVTRSTRDQAMKALLFLHRNVPDMPRTGMGRQYAFPARNSSVDPRSGETRRHHVNPSAVSKALKVAIRRVDIAKRVSARTFLHSFATCLLQRGTDVRTIQALPGHRSDSKTTNYAHVLRQAGHGVTSPPDDLEAGGDTLIRSAAASLTIRLGPS